MMVELEHNLCSWFFIYKTSSIFGRVWKHLILFPSPLKDQTTTWMDGLPITQGCEAASYALVQHKLGCGGSIVPPANVQFQWIPDLYISMLRIDRDGCIVVKSLWGWPAGYMRPPRVLCKCKDVRRVANDSRIALRRKFIICIIVWLVAAMLYYINIYVYTIVCAVVCNCKCLCQTTTCVWESTWVSACGWVAMCFVSHMAWTLRYGGLRARRQSDVLRRIENVR